jgi:hypothetical protein
VGNTEPSSLACSSAPRRALQPIAPPYPDRAQCVLLSLQHCPYAERAFCSATPHLAPLTCSTAPASLRLGLGIGAKRDGHRSGSGLSDERLVPDLSRGRGRSVGGDLDIGEEGSEQTIETLQSLHHDSVSYQHACTRVGLAKKAKSLSMQPRT